MQPLLEALFLSLKKEVNMSDKLLDNIVNTEQFIKYIYIYIWTSANLKSFGSKYLLNVQRRSVYGTWNI